jgi:hypothetical protein
MLLIPYKAEADNGCIVVVLGGNTGTSEHEDHAIMGEAYVALDKHPVSLPSMNGGKDVYRPGEWGKMRCME